MSVSETTTREVNPFDLTGTAQALAEGLSMSPTERARRARSLRSLVVARDPGQWLDDQLAAAQDDKDLTPD